MDRRRLSQFMGCVDRGSRAAVTLRGALPVGGLEIHDIVCPSGDGLSNCLVRGIALSEDGSARDKAFRLGDVEDIQEQAMQVPYFADRHFVGRNPVPKDWAQWGAVSPRSLTSTKAAQCIAPSAARLPRLTRSTAPSAEHGYRLAYL